MIEQRRSTPVLEATTIIEDVFDEARPPGHVIGTSSTSGHRRLGADREGVIGIDNGQLRIGWLRHGGWGRASVAYGPVDGSDGLLLVVRALNGLMTAQSDPRPEGRRGMLRRIRATLPHASWGQPRLTESLLIGWFDGACVDRRPSPVAAVSHRAGADATGELWFQAGSREVMITNDLQNLPAVYAVALSGRTATLHAWSYPSAHGFGDWGRAEPLAELPLDAPPPPRVYAAIHQPVSGEVHYRVDTRVEWIRVLRSSRPAVTAASFSRPSWWTPLPGGEVYEDDFAGPAEDLRGALPQVGGHAWRRVMGEGVIERTGEGRARVQAGLGAPNPGRTVYCLPWHDRDGAAISARITPPGTRRGEGHQGRSGLVLWQDPDNHLVVNHFIDDGSVGVSISAFLRVRGEETMFEWDAVWSNVAQRVRWGHPFELSVACDGRQFLCRIGDEPVLYRRFTDYRRDAPVLQINGVGLVANWEWGDDTGTGFSRFAARRLAPTHVPPTAAHAATPGGPRGRSGRPKDLRSLRRSEHPAG